MNSQLSSAEHARALLASGATIEAVRLLSGAADRGDPEALYELGLWHVYGSPVRRDFSSARVLFERAGAAGHGAGAITHAVFIALGAGAAPDWRQAIDVLEKAAHHDGRAAKQMALIDAMDLDGEGRPSRSLEIEPQSELLPVAVARSLFSAAESAHVMELSQPLLVPSVVVDPVTGKQGPHPIRTSDGTVLGPIQQDLVVHALNQRLASATGTRVDQGEPLAVLRYAPGQQYRLHHDCLPGERNQRVITALTYLNDSYAGGETEFPAIDFAFRGEKGDAILFANIRPDGQPEALSQHAGLPVTQGEKWICTRWIRASIFDPWQMRGSN